ncbi:hypothetical protein CBA19CS42_11805 [Caballeronia novacaledonica]|uniref:Uncharacterized protein n=1 Tax=Caballeronia novacaledonica TaxID=1544861 RepID=A0AA37MS28_9BURK|nr:hypothetical protein [Caballeronia novacaledonica]GJH25199.1 hypothetical protein CBA19CS42_11805 [Caballeronia novacaledonica]
MRELGEQRRFAHAFTRPRHLKTNVRVEELPEGRLVHEIRSEDIDVFVFTRVIAEQRPVVQPDLNVGGVAAA